MKMGIINNRKRSVVAIMLHLTMLFVTNVQAGMPASRKEFTPFGESFESRGFKQIADRKGVRVYKHGKSKLIHLAAEGRVDAPPAKVRQALLAYEAQPGVIERVSVSRILSRDDHRILVYQRLDLPAIDDRDYTLWVTWGESDGVQWIRYWRAKNLGPAEQDDAVRVPHHQGSWQLKPINGGRATLVRYQVSIDMGGVVPRWMAKSAAGNEVQAVYQDICRVLAVQGNEPRSCLL
jgi:hypothetical protein